MNRSRTNNLLKIEKENENKDIKIKQKTSQPRGSASVLINATTSQCLGKQSAKYTGGRSKSSCNNDPHVSSYRQSAKSQLSTFSIQQNEQFVESTDSNVKSIGIFPNHKPLSPYMAPTPGPKPRLGQRQKRPPKQTVLSTSHLGKHQEDQQSAKPFTNQELPMYSPCSTDNPEDFSSKSKDTCNKIPLTSSTSENQSSRTWKRSESARLDYISPKSRPEKLSTYSGSSAYINLDLDFCSLGSSRRGSEIFYVAPLLSVPNSRSSLDSGASLERKFRYALDIKENFMEDDDIKMIKNILKTDKNHELLRNKNGDPNIFKDILKSQLEGIIRNEEVIKTALLKLGDSKEIKLDSSNEIVEVAELLHQSNKKLRHKSKRRHISLPVHPTSEDSSSERINRSHFEVQDSEMLNDNLDTRSAKLSKRYYEKCYLYSHKYNENLKHQKSIRRNDAQKEYEEFLKNTLSFKQKNYHKKEESPASVIDPSQIQKQLDVQELSKNDDQKSMLNTARRPQVNVTFKNVTSPEKEILILRALGDRLEATLKRTISEPSLTDLERKQDICGSSSMSSLTKELQKIDSSIKIYPGRRLAERYFGFVRLMDVIPWKQQRAEYLIFSYGLRQEIGIANEFVIVSKTIDELRSDANSSFYIPKSGQLLRTSFENLKNEPDLFLQILKPKNEGQAFNLLDHDPVFFNNLLRPAIKQISKLEIRSIGAMSKENVTICEGGDSMIAAAEGVKKKHKKFGSKAHSTRSSLAGKKPNEEALVKKQKTSEPSSSKEMSKQSENFLTKSGSSVPLLSNRRSHIRRLITPMPFDAFDEPKNTLLKNILIGVIQVSLFMGLIVALTLPDIKC